MAAVGQSIAEARESSQGVGAASRVIHTTTVQI
jgi:hypothetical protein